MNYTEAKILLERYNQLHLLDYYGELSEEERRILLDKIAEIDFTVLEKLPQGEKKELGKLSPADAVSLKQIEADRERLENIGVEAIRGNKVAAVLLAGGQGTRLGWNAPKGTFNIGVNRELSIFECQMNNLKAVAKRAGFAPHLFVMTSTLNHAQTTEFFEKHGYFGYDSKKIHFYVQKTAPAISFDGKILMEEKYAPVLAPNGNGGWYNSLREAECGKILDNEKIEWLNVYGVDNVLQKICDPAFIGATIDCGLNCSSKVVTKASPEEKVGVLCKQDGLPAIVEYYEMPEELKTLRGADGQLVYRFGVTLNYLFKIEKLEEICKKSLPYHLANKKVSCIVGGKKIIPEQPNGYKLETLAVDIVKMMGSCLAVEVERNREFAPVKNATGVDSVDTARELLKLNGVSI